MKDFAHLSDATKEAIGIFLKYAKVLASRSKAASISDRTFQEYICTAKSILKRCSASGLSLEEFFTNINSKATFYKSIACLRAYILDVGIPAVKTLVEAHCPIAEYNIRKAAVDLSCSWL